MKMQKGEAVTAFAVVLFLSFVGMTFIAANNNTKVEKLEAAAAIQQK